MELSIDTSTDSAGVVLAKEGLALIQLSWHSTQNHTVELLPSIAFVVKRGGIGMASLGAVFVAKGPGSYNGLRVGMSAAKGLALSLGIPLVGISTLELEAYPFGGLGLPVRPVQRAGQGQVATALYSMVEGQLACREGEQLVSPDELRRLSHERTILCGDMAHETLAWLQPELGKYVAAPAIFASRAVALAALGWTRLLEGRTDDPATLEPLYLRPPHITGPKQRR